MIFKLSTFVFKRIAKDLVSLSILFITPLVLITILGLVADDAINPRYHLPETYLVSLSMILAFQLFTGFYTLELMKEDILGKRKWRMLSLPLPIHQYLYAIILVTSLFSALQGFALAQYTAFVYGVSWGNPVILLAKLALFSTLIQLIYLNLALFLKKYKTMERVATGIGLGSILLGEVWFTFPDFWLFNLLSTYGNPYSLGENIFIDGMRGTFSTTGNLSIIVLLLLLVVLILMSSVRGKQVYP